jgi:ElaB/YqjD/DUF883 family membrane-anchored ribosome-binding protein
MSSRRTDGSAQEMRMDETIGAKAVALEPTGGPGSDDGAQRIQRSKEKLLRDLQTVASDARVLVRDAAESSTQRLASARRRFEDRWSGARSDIDRARGALREQTRRATDVTGDHLKQNPWRSIGLAATAGMVLGLLLVRAWIAAPGETKTQGEQR